MIVTCPSCSARYKISESKIKGRGAKITCPRCAHRFVVYRDQGAAPVPDDIDGYDFGTLGITWRVRKGIGLTYKLTDLRSLKAYMQDGQVERWDQITFDNRAWTSIESHDSLEELFWDVWQRAQRGEVTIHPADDEEGGDDEDDSDAPTTIVGRGSSLASEIRNAVSEAATPAPAAARGSDDAGQLLLDDGAAEVAPDEDDGDEDDADRNTVMHSTPPASADIAAAALLEAPAAAPAPAPPPPAAPAPAPPANEAGGPSIGLIIAGVLMLAVLGAVSVWGAGVFGSTPSVPKPAPSEAQPTEPAPGG